MKFLAVLISALAALGLAAPTPQGDLGLDEGDTTSGGLGDGYGYHLLWK